MRKIKYRVWDKNGSRCDESMFRLGLDGILWKYCCGCDWYDQDSKDFTVEQFTGLLDVNFTEMWEGDIVEETNTYYNTKTHGVIEYVDGSFMINSHGFYSYADVEPLECRSVRVIGNIHQNPELLNEEEEE